MRNTGRRIGTIALVAALLAGVCAAQPAKPATPPPQPDAGAAAVQSISAALTWADARRAEGSYDLAVGALQKILSRDPSNIDALRMLGDIAYERQDAEEAEKRWKAVREIQPNDFGANWGLGRLNLTRQTSLRPAIYYLEIAESVVPADDPALKSQVLVALTQAYAGNQENRKALDTVREVLRADPDNFNANYLLAALRARLAQTEDDYDQALAAAERVVDIVRRDLETSGTSEERVRRLQSAYQLELDILRVSGNVLFERNPDGSLSDRLQQGKSQRAAKTFSKTVDIMVRQADLQRTLSYYRIIQLAAQAVQYDATPGTLMNLELLQKAVGQYAEASETFSHVLEIDPLHKEARRQLEALHAQQPGIEAAPEALMP